MVFESLSALILLSILVEMATNTVNKAFTLKGEVSKIIALMIGIILCISTQIGVLANLNIAIKYPLVDYIITGIIISRGSNAAHNLISILEKNIIT